MDAALADYIKQFAAGALEFAADTENEGHGSIAPDGSIVPDDASSADTVGAPSPTSFYKTASASAPRDARRVGEKRYLCQCLPMLLHEERAGPCLVPSNRTLHSVC